MTIKVFVSYSHQDEWLKDELIEHLGALQRGGHIETWHDRKIIPGSIVDTEILRKLAESQIIVFLVSPSFISSNYCMEKEYRTAQSMHERGEASIVPITVRECDWDVYGLKQYLALPTDALAVTKGAGSRSDTQQRDGRWLEVVNGLKAVISDVKKKLTAPSLLSEYAEDVFKVDFVRHPSLAEFDERRFWVDPELYFEKTKRQINKLSELVNLIKASNAVVVSGADRSGKSLLAKKIQAEMCANGGMTILISGGQIKNADIKSLLRKEAVGQFGSDSFPRSRATIIIDDFDSCVLPDSIKEKLIRELSGSCERTVIFSFSSAATVLYAPDDLPNPMSLTISPLGDDKIYEIVRKWKLENGGKLSASSDEALTRAFEKIMLLFNQTEAEKYAYNVITFLELVDSVVGGDIAPSSFASCYETLILQRLIRSGCDFRRLDEVKNFLSLVAYRAYTERNDSCLSSNAFQDCIEIFSEQYLSSPRELMKSAELFLSVQGREYEFFEDYLWYFLCARYVAKRLKNDDHELYVEFIRSASESIFQKKYANIVIYLAYFTEDNLVLRELMALLDKLFAKAEDWRLSDKSRSIILGLASSDQLSISSSASVDENRAELMRGEVRSIVEDAEQVVARYTLPFLDPNVADSGMVEGLESSDIDGDSYIKSVNALLRTHSVIGQILNTRSGTYNADLVVGCIEKMVQASGRYAALNHAIATLLIFDPDLATKTANKVLRVDGMSEDEKYKKVMRIFAFWSVFLSQTGLARYLSHDHAIRALERLVEKHESDACDHGHIPFNFFSVLLIARLYCTGKLDKLGIEAAIGKYGKDSSMFAVLRATIHIYSYYMPMAIEEKQWISDRLGLPIRTLEVQGMRARLAVDINKKSLLEFDPTEKDEE